MKLVRQVVLVYLEGRTEKVYEIDLAEVGSNQYVVNFRYGKRGAALKDGSKTPMPVPMGEALRVYDRLVAQKTEQGYLSEGAVVRPPPGAAPPARAPATPTAPRAAAPSGPDPRAHKILERLSTPPSDRRWFRRGAAASSWRLERVIWRAGELRLREAEPLLLRLVGTAAASDDANEGGRGMRDYCIAWALGRCGSDASISTLGRLYGDASTPPHVRRIACEALIALSDDATKREFRDDLIEKLPEALRAAAKGDDPNAFGLALGAYFGAGDKSRIDVLETLYTIDTPAVRASVLEAIGGPLKAPLFRVLRHIFKAAEYRRDAEVFGRIAHRFEKERANPSPWDPRQRKDAPFGPGTRLYMRRRVWRTLRRLGEIADPDYVKMAVGVLLPFQDADAGEARRSGDARYDRFAAYWAFNHILYGQSSRYEPSPRGRLWRCSSPYRPGGLPPPGREEAFPALWEQKPAGLMPLAAESACLPVHEMAAKALSACPAFLDALDVDDLVMLLGRPYEPTAKLGFDLAKRRYVEARPDPALLLALAHAVYKPAREQAYVWIERAQSSLSSQSAFLASLVLSPREDTRAFTRRWLRTLSLAPDVGAALLGRVIVGLLALSPASADDAAIAIDAARLVVAALDPFLKGASIGVVRDLIAHPLAGCQELGAELLSRFDARSGLIPQDLVLGLLHSPHGGVRAVGLRLISELSDEVLLMADRLVARLVCDKNPDVRAVGRTIVQRLARTQPEAAAQLAEQLVAALVRRKLPDGVPSFVLAVLKDDLRAGLASLPQGAVWQLVTSESQHAQELGGILLPTHLPKESLTIEQIVALASHDVLAVREAAWAMCEASVPRLADTLPEAVRILDAKWDDSRAWAKRFFRERFAPEAFTVDVVTTIIDSVRDDVQTFGREMAQRGFRAEDGPAMLERTAEHPTRNVQLFATNYLDRFASGNLERIEKLVPYFTSVLSRVNQGRVAKARVLAFLRAEGLKSEPAARLVVAILERISATISIEYRAQTIEAMVAVGRAHPNVVLPLKTRPPERRAGSLARAQGARR